MMGQEVQGLEYLNAREKEDFKRQVDYYKKLCSASDDVTLISKLSMAKSEYSQRCETFEKLVKHNKTKNKVKTVDNKAAAMMLNGLRESSSKKSAAPTRQRVDPQSPAPTRRSVDTQNKVAPASPTPIPRPSKGNDMTAAERRIRAMANASKGSNKQMHAITQEATQRGRERFNKKQQAKKEALEARIAALIEKIKEADIAKRLRERFLKNVVQFAGDHINDDWDRRGYNDICLRNLSFQIKKLEMKLVKMNFKLEASQEELYNEFYNIKKDEIVGYTGLDNVEERETTDL